MDCGFSFAHPFIGGNEAFYNILHEQSGYPKWRWDYDVAKQQATNPIGRGRIIDVGAGEGAFLNSLDPSWERFAVEGGPVTRNRLRAHGITVYEALEVAAKSLPNKFHVVTMFQVLEHLSDFRETLSLCRNLLTAGGKIVVTVPDGDAMIRQERLLGCPDMPPHHVGKWTPNSLSIALKRAGFKPDTAVYEPASFKNIAGSLQLRILADAAKPRTLAAQAYRVSNKRMRVPLLAALGVGAAIRLVRHLNELRKGGTFAMTATAS